MKSPLVFEKYRDEIDAEIRSVLAGDHRKKALAEMLKIVPYPGHAPTCVIRPTLLGCGDVEVSSLSQTARHV